jgi:hypothetical protein
MPAMTRLIALSAAYGAAGSRVGPALAERLGVPFLDRAIPLAVAERLEVPLDVAVEHDESVSRSLLERMLQGFIGADAGAPMPPTPELISEQDFRAATEEVLRRQAATGEGVILGRGAAFLLREDPAVLRVRLHGPPEARLRRAVELQGLDEETARRGLTHADRAHAEYAKRFYGANIDDPRLYQLMLDGTAFPVEELVELIARAAFHLGEPG